MNYGRAMMGGAIGAIAVTFYNLTLRWLGMQIDIEMILGTLFGGMPGPGMWWIGFGIHVVMGMIFGVIYAFFFELGTRRTGWLAGVKIAVLQIIVSGFLYGFFPVISPVIPHYLNAPGYFMAHHGFTYIIAFTGMYLLFGIVMGLTYKINGWIQMLPIEQESEESERIRLEIQSQELSN